MSFRRVLPFLSLLFALLLAALPASAADGRIEINQALVDDAGGFPYSIDTPASYVLTGSLQVPADTDGIVITAEGVALDLNGFAVEGTATCEPGNCPLGNGRAISGGSAHTTVRNGRVQGFANTCISVGPHSMISDLIVSDCGGNGIGTGAWSLVKDNRVQRIGGRGISMAVAPAESSAYAHNVVSSANLTILGTAIQGGRATAGNVCEDGSCQWVDDRRRFYLTTGTFDGVTAPDACDAGFHMASVWEILDPTQLRYDTIRGRTSEDSGLGPPSDFTVGTGWVRTGKSMNVLIEAPGGMSCQGYTTTEGAGTAVSLHVAWQAGFAASTDDRLPWWDGILLPCGVPQAVWCVED